MGEIERHWRRWSNCTGNSVSEGPVPRGRGRICDAAAVPHVRGCMLDISSYCKSPTRLPRMPFQRWQRRRPSQCTHAAAVARCRPRIAPLEALCHDAMGRRGERVSIHACSGVGRVFTCQSAQPCRVGYAISQNNNRL